MPFNSQEDFLDFLNANFTRAQLVTIMRDAMNVAKPTAYRYLAGSIPIHYNQLMKLMKHPDVIPKLHQINQTSSSNILWNYPPFDSGSMDGYTYVKNINNFLKLLENRKVELRYSSYEVPIFYYMYYPNLFAFKIFTWSRTIWHTPTMVDTKFNPDAILTPELLALIEDTLNRFCKMASIEYWTDQLFDNTIRQVHYFRQLEYFNSITSCKSLALDIKKLIGLMRVMAATGSKLASDRTTPGSEVTIYKNEIYFTNNIVSAISDEYSVTFCAFDNPNFIITMDQKFGRRTAEWLDSMRNGCTRLTQNSDLVRKEFFQTMEYKLDMLGFTFD